jgi:glycosyltransferase involved in cell wall biosynthesis
MLFTVFTPSYNRRHLLHRVFDSLKAQTCRDFEWIVVDDGSTDDTKSLVEEYLKTADFPARLFVQSRNMGKHMAWNLAVKEAKGELFVIADSDDAFTPDSLEVMARTWFSIPEPQRNSYVGVNALCQDSETGEVVGDLYPKSPFDANALELTYVYKVKGEKWGCTRTELLRQTPFPESGGSHFAENYVWMTLARKYKGRCVNEKLRIFFDDRRSDRLTQERRATASASRFEAAYAWNALHLNMNFDYMVRTPRELIVTVANLGRYGLVLGKSASASAKLLTNPGKRILFWLVYPLAYYLYRKDVSTGRVQPAAV